MDTSTTTFCRFSPLRTPSIHQKGIRKYDSPTKEASDAESLVSVVTSDLRKIAYSVSEKMRDTSEMDYMSSDNDLFVSQSKKVASPQKKVKKRAVSESGSSSSEPDTVKSPTSKNRTQSSPKKRQKVSNNITHVHENIKSPSKSSKKSKRKQNDHEISEDSEGSSDQDSSKRRSSVSSVLTSSTNSSNGRRSSASSMASSNPSERSKKGSDSESGDSDKSSSDSDNGSDTRKKMKNSGKRKEKQNVTSDDSASDSGQSKKSRNKSKTIGSKECSSIKERPEKLRYKIPEHFEIERSSKYLSHSETKGKQLWLITAPDDFDITQLDGQKISLTGSSMITTGKSEKEKEYEVVARPYSSQMSKYNSVVSEKSGKEEFVLGSEISGQLQIMDWIPAMPPVELVISSAKKHRVPDNLKPTFVPFGSESPTRQSMEESFKSPKTEKHKKKKKKKDKRKE